MRIALVALVLLVSTTAFADRWTVTDTALQVAVGVSLAADYVQTRQIVADGREGNAMVRATGGHPELYFVGAALCSTAISVVLPQPYRRIAQGVTLGVQIDAIHTNWQAGYSLSF